MSRTHKDSGKNKRRDIEVVRLGEDCFDVIISGELAREHISGRTLNDILCIRFGYCGPEFDEILREVNAQGRKKILT